MDSKKVLITGGNKGIGLETTKLFNEKNFEVIVLGRDFSDFSIDAKTVEFDLSKVEKIPSLAEKIGPIDILINNAGIMNALPYNEYPNHDKLRILNVNLEAPIELIKAFAPEMIEQGEGRIVNVASIAGQVGHPDIWYGITKAGVINVTKSFAKILGPKGIIVNSVAPGPVDTDMLSTIPDERKDALKASSILNRFARPSEVAETIYWLATVSPKNINGICIDVNNGAHFR
jgi:3-oxoacyl-[acyl-carrier protein] reductase